VTAIIGAIPGLTPAVALLAALTLMAFITLVRAWAPLKQLGMTESERLRLDRRRDYRELRNEFEIMKVRSSIVEKHCTAVDVRMGQLEFIIGLTFDELDRIDVNNAVAKKGREMFSRLYPVPPIDRELERLKEAIDPLHSPIGRDEPPPADPRELRR
jgi:hypothetical protein